MVQSCKTFNHRGRERPLSKSLKTFPIVVALGDYCVVAKLGRRLEFLSASHAQKSSTSTQTE